MKKGKFFDVFDVTIHNPKLREHINSLPYDKRVKAILDYSTIKGQVNFNINPKYKQALDSIAPNLYKEGNLNNEDVSLILNTISSNEGLNRAITSNSIGDTTILPVLEVNAPHKGDRTNITKGTYKLPFTTIDGIDYFQDSSLKDTGTSYYTKEALDDLYFKNNPTYFSRQSLKTLKDKANLDYAQRSWLSSGNLDNNDLDKAYLEQFKHNVSPKGVLVDSNIVESISRNYNKGKNAGLLDYVDPIVDGIDLLALGAQYIPQTKLAGTLVGGAADAYQIWRALNKRNYLESASNVGELMLNSIPTSKFKYGKATSVLGNALTRLGSAVDNDRYYKQRDYRLDKKDIQEYKFNEYSKGGLMNFTEFNTGGLHEQNPYGGIPMGIGMNGKPNLVEEGETKYNDYIFSDRLIPSDNIIDELGLPKHMRNKSYSDISKYLMKESEERPNDIISKRGKEYSMSKLIDSQENTKQYKQQHYPNTFAEGGDLEEYPFDFMDDVLLNPWAWGSTALSIGLGSAANKYLKLNPRTRITRGIKRAYRGTGRAFKELPSNLGNAGRAAVQFVKAHPKSTATIGSLGLGLGGISLAKEDIWSPTEQRTRDYEHTLQSDSTYNAISKELNDLKSSLYGKPYKDADIVNIKKLEEKRLQREHQLLGASPLGNSYSLGGDLLRYAPIVASGIHSLTDLLGLTNKQDYTNADKVASLANNYKDYTYSPIGTKMEYNPLDFNYHANKLSQQSAATRSHIMNTSGANRSTALAGLLAGDLNAQLALGNLARQTQEHNNAQRNQVLQYNNQLDQLNEQRRMQVEQTNTALQQLRDNLVIKGLSLRDREDQLSGLSRTQNLNTFVNNLGSLGRELVSLNTANSMYPYKRNLDGTISYKFPTTPTPNSVTPVSSLPNLNGLLPDMSTFGKYRSLFKMYK